MKEADSKSNISTHLQAYFDPNFESNSNLLNLNKNTAFGSKIRLNSSLDENLIQEKKRYTYSRGSKTRINYNSTNAKKNT